MTAVADPTAGGLLASPVRRDLLALLDALPVAPTPTEPHSRDHGLTAKSLADRLGLHVTTVRFHVDQLVAAGLVATRDARGQVGRPKRHYVATHPAPVMQQAEAYRLLATLLAEAMQSSDRLSPREAGRRWVERHSDELIPRSAALTRSRTPQDWLAKVGVLVDLLRGWGYAPTVREGASDRTTEIELAQCPLRQLAATHPTVACGVHEGIVRGTLGLLGEPDADVTVAPCPASRLCLARLTTRADFQGGQP